MALLHEEQTLLWGLAREVRDISQSPVLHEKTRLWRDKNSLKKVRPLILCSLPDQAWNELIPECSLTVHDPLFRGYEWDLKRRIYRWENLKDDEVITDRIYVPIQRKLTDWIEGRARPYTEHPDRAARFSPCILEYEDLRKLRYPELSVDWQASRARYDEVQDTFGDILRVEFGEPYYAGTDGDVMGWGNSLIDILCELRGLDSVYFDFCNAPDFVHEAMQFLLEGTLKYLDDLDRENLLRLNNNEFIRSSNTPLGSNGLGITDELPRNGWDPHHVTTEHLWGYFQAQELTGVSADMLEEFVLPYQAQIAKRFGLNCYGCCEPNDLKWDRILKRLPHLRELSVSHASRLEIAAEKLRGDYVFSWKPHPVEMITTFDEEPVRRTLKSAFDITRDCCVVVCLRDTQTLDGKPEQTAEWTRIALEVAGEYP